VLPFTISVLEINGLVGLAAVKWQKTAGFGNVWQLF